MKMYKRTAKPVSYANKERSKKDIRYIVIHYTGGIKDTAKNNVDYFATGNTRQAGAHFFVDQNGEVARSIPMNRTAWAVGGDQRSGVKGEATYYGKCTNANSVSIELCDNAVKNPSKEQIEAVKRLIKYIRKYCPYANTIIRHWDVNGKTCPIRMTGIDATRQKRWNEFKRQIDVR